MKEYQAPIEEIMFLLQEVLDYKSLINIDKFKDFNDDLVAAVLNEAAKFSGGKLAPLNIVGDKEGCKITDSKVKTPSGFKDVYREFVENGWNSVPFEPEFGGQGFPKLIATAISEMWSGANMAFGLCPLLTQGSVELLLHHGSVPQKEKYLRNLISGNWTGTMCLTEPQAGSDVGAVTTSAVKNGDHYLIKGQKIFITYGEHDFTDNIIHMVLARVKGAPEGVKGISLFIVPKILDDGKRNDLKAVSIEHKMGIHASPTAVMSFGDNAGAVGYLVGAEGDGLKAMFTMMNNARLSVAIEGIAVAENSYQKSWNYANERVQGARGKKQVAIINHPDVKRMLLNIASNTEAARAIAYYVAKCIDVASSHGDEKERAKNNAIVQILIPVIKSYATDVGFLMSSEAMQVFGGVGYIEETGIAQNVRDARIALIYEGTNGIQARDLVMRKMVAEDGKLFSLFAEELKELAKKCDNFTVMAIVESLCEVTKYLQSKLKNEPDAVEFYANYYCRMVALTIGGVMMSLKQNAAKKLLADKKGNAEFLNKKIENSEFYLKYILPEINFLADIVTK